MEDYYQTYEFAYLDTNTDNASLMNNQSFYDETNTNFLISNSDNILILVTAILFKDEKFYNHIFHIFKKYHEKKEMRLKAILSGIKDAGPEYFQVKKEYCLNDFTL